MSFTKNLFKASSTYTPGFLVFWYYYGQTMWLNFGIYVFSTRREVLYGRVVEINNFDRADRATFCFATAGIILYGFWSLLHRVIKVINLIIQLWVRSLSCIGKPIQIFQLLQFVARAIIQEELKLDRNISIFPLFNFQAWLQ